MERLTKFKFVAGAIVIGLALTFAWRAIVAVRQPADHLAVLRPYALWTHRGFYRVQTYDGVTYSYTSSMDLTGISYADAVNLESKAVDLDDGESRGTHSATTLGTRDGSIQIIAGPVPFEKNATASVIEHIDASDFDSWTLEILRKIGVRLKP